MSFERTIILTKLRAYLTGELTQTELYEWGLFVAVSADYEELIKNDKLSEQVMKFVLDLIHPQSKTFPVRQVVQYFIECLENRKSFDAQEFKIISGEKPSGVKSESANKTSETVRPSLNPSHPWIQLGLKIYLLLFVLFSLLVHVAMLLKPDFMVSPQENLPVYSEVLRSALPHIFYAALMLGALFLRMSWVIFYLNFFVATLGMFYYWYFTIDYVYKHQLPVSAFFMISPLIAFPPTAGFFLMLNRWFDGETRGLMQTNPKSS